MSNTTTPPISTTTPNISLVSNTTTTPNISSVSNTTTTPNISSVSNTTTTPNISSVSNTKIQPNTDIQKQQNNFFIPKSKSNKTTVNDLLAEIGKLPDQSQTNGNGNEVERLNKLNDTYRKRYIEYIKIILVIVIALICVWLCRILENMDYISSSTSDFTLIKILGVTVIIIYVLYKNINIHNLIIYDQIDYQSPEIVDPGTPGPTKNTTSSPDNTDAPEKCIQAPIIGESIFSNVKKSYFP